MSATTTTPVQARTEPARLRRFWGIVLQRYSLVLLWLLMIIVLIIAVPGDVSMVSALRAVLGQQTPLIFLGLAVVITMAVGELFLAASKPWRQTSSWMSSRIRSSSSIAPL